MDVTRFVEVKKEFQIKEDRLLNVKREDYAHSQDVLSNFKEGADFLYETPEMYCLNLVTKHLLVIKKAVLTDRIDWSWEGSSGEGLKQRIADARNFLLLLACNIEEGQGPTILPHSESTEENGRID